MSAIQQTPADASAPARDALTAEPAAAFSIQLRLNEQYVQVVDFDLEAATQLVVDEPPPLGWNAGPNPTRLLGAAVGSCLGASLLFCLRKSRVAVHDLRTTVEGTLVRNERGRLRIGSLRVHLAPGVAAEDRARLARCTELFEDFCIVTQSVREGMAVALEVAPA